MHHRETRKHLHCVEGMLVCTFYYCMWGVVVGSFFYCMYNFFRWGRRVLVNFLNFDCFFSNLSGGKDTQRHPMPEGDYITAC